MALKDILVHVDGTPHCAARLDLAINIARENQAHLTGLYVISHPHYKPRSEGDEFKTAEAEAGFNEKVAQAGISAEWLCADWTVTGVSMSEIVNLHAYCKDLVIVGQTDHGSQDEDVPRDLPDRVVLGSGRPVLVVPYAGTFNTVGDRVLVSWKSGRESTRALNDAMPFLQGAQQVSVLEVNDPAAPEGAAKSPGADVCAHLNHHDIAATSDQLVSADVAVGDVLLNHAWEEGCDLLVMGAYTHTSRGALALGTVARHVLRHMTLPVLMSH